MNTQLTFSDLRTANERRQREWCPDQLPDLSFRGNELAGETGEACNVIKKLERERQGWRGSRGSKEQLAEELADVIICCDLVAMQCGIDLGDAVRAKFNATSEKNGLAVKLDGSEVLRVCRANLLKLYTAAKEHGSSFAEEFSDDARYCLDLIDGTPQPSQPEGEAK